MRAILVTTIPVVLVLLVVLVASSFISRVLPAAVPRPLVQMAIGALIGLSPALQVDLDPQLFFLLFVPPLLFFDGWRIPNEDLVHDRVVNLQLALGLVAFTVVGIGWFVHWLIPGMPLAVAFAFAAAVSPTDAISVTSTAGNLPIASRMMRILSSESLLNDATGLVCLHFAVVAVLTGNFFLSQALLDFMWIATGGIALGFATTLVVAGGSNLLALRMGEEAGVQIVTSVLIPFLAYALAEALHCSGVLAAVSAGLAMSYVETSGIASATTRVQRTSVWETIHFATNGIVFILLGEQLPKLIAATDRALYAVGERHVSWLLLYVIVIYAALIVIRCLWLAIVLPRELLWANNSRSIRQFKWRELAVMTLASPRGAITLAGAMTLPFWLRDGVPFPGRDMVILLAMGIILISLIAAGTALPALLRTMDTTEPSNDRQENMARVFSAKAALDAVSRIEQDLKGANAYNDNHAHALSRLNELYSTVIESKSRDGRAAEKSRETESVGRELRISAIKAERDAIFELLREQKIDSELADKLIRELDLLQTHHDEQQDPKSKR